MNKGINLGLKLSLLKLLLCFAIFVQAQVDFTAGSDRLCLDPNNPDGVISFSYTPTGGEVNYTWELLDNGGTVVATNDGPGLENTFFNINTAGAYGMRLTVDFGGSTESEEKPFVFNAYISPNPSFEGDVLEGCSPHTVCFTDQTVQGSNPIATWSYSFGGAPVEEQNPCIEFTAGATTQQYGITLEVTDDQGCNLAFSRTDYITVNPEPVAAFSADTRSACTGPLTTNLDASGSAGVGITYAWYHDGVVDGAPDATGVTTSVTNTADGQYSIALVVTDGTGCADTLVEVDYISIGSPAVDMQIDPTEGCTNPQTVFTYTDNTAGATISTWEFGDGQTIIGNPVTHTYTTPGTYQVILTSSNGTCEGKDTIDVVVQNLTADLDPKDANFCDNPSVVNFTSLGTGATSWAWDFGDPASGAANTSTDENPTHTFGAAGNYNVSLTVMNDAGCIETASTTVNVNIITISATHSPEDGGCAPLDVTFDLINVNTPLVIDRVIWNYGDGSPIETEPGTWPQQKMHTYTTRGEYNATVTVESDAQNCTATEVFEVLVGSKGVITDVVLLPAAPVAMCIDSTFEFEAITSDSFTYFSWFLDDGSGWQDGGDDQTTYEYDWERTDSIGEFFVRTLLFDNGCVSDTFTRDDSVVALGPLARFRVNDVICDTPFYRSFTNDSKNDSVNGYGTHHKVFWDFGDDARFDDTSDIWEPDWHYDSAGNYMVVLTLMDTLNGCINEDSFEVIVKDPHAEFQIVSPLDSMGCTELTVEWNAVDSSIDADLYFWDFDEGAGYESSPTAPGRPVYTYVNPDTFHVNLRVVAQLERGQTCEDTAYLLPGPYDTINIGNPVKVYQHLVPTFLPADTAGCDSFEVTFTAINEHSAQTFTNSWKWYVDGVAVDSGSTDTALADNYGIRNDTFYFTHTFTNIGVSTVEFESSDTFGCSRRTPQATVRVSKPSAGIVGDEYGCLDTDYNFTATPGQQNYLWLVNGDTAAIGPNEDIFDTSSAVRDTFYITSIIFDNQAACRDTAYDTIIFDQPIADFADIDTFECTAGGTVVNFTPIIDNVDPITDYLWEFGDPLDPSTSNFENATHNYQKPGQFNVCLSIESSPGCRDTICKDSAVVILGPFADSFSYTHNGVCTPLEVTFRVHGVRNTSNYLYEVAPGVNVLALDSVYTYTYDTCGFYEPKLKLSKIGCESVAPFTPPQAQANAPINMPCYEADFDLPPDSCLPYNVLVRSTSTADDLIFLQTFTFGTDGSSESSSQPQPVLHDIAGIHDITLAIETSSGCRDTITKSIEIYGVPFIEIEGQKPLKYCLGDTAQLFATDDPSYTYHWTPDIALSDDSVRAPFIYNDMNERYSVRVTDGFGCQNVSDTIDVIVFQPLEVNAFSDTTIYINTFAYLRGEFENNLGVTKWWWLPDNADNEDVDSTSIRVKPFQNTEYTFYVVDSNFCDTFSASVFVEIDPEIRFEMPQAFTPNGDGVNELFGIQGININPDREITFMIFNRWGELVFTTTDANESWDGTYKDLPQPIDTYYYTIIVKGYLDEIQEEYNGRFNLFR